MRQQYKGFTLVELLVVIAIIGTLLALLNPFHAHPARERARQATCKHNLELIAKAIRSYENEHGTLPPAHTTDENGRRLHSWRTLILPYLEQEALYNSIELTKPWNDPANEEARNTRIECFQCPSSPNSPEEKGFTTYLAITGKHCIFADHKVHKLKEVPDESSSTICVIDASYDFATHWMSPKDIDERNTFEMFQTADTKHPGIYYVAYLDGHADLVPSDVSLEDLHEQMSIGEAN